MGFAQGGVKTSIHVPDFNVTFDAGCYLPFPTSKYFITHGHPDHISALPYIIAQRGILKLDDPLQVYVHHKIAPLLTNALATMETIYGGKRPDKCVIHPVKEGDVIPLSKTQRVVCLPTYHRGPTCGWVVQETHKKLRPDLVGYPGHEIAKLKREGVEVSVEEDFNVLAVPGDTTIDFLVNHEEAQKSRVLVHEVTYWDSRSDPVACRKSGHTHIDDMLRHVSLFQGDSLVLVHRSMKYMRKEVEGIAKKRFPTSIQPKIKIFDGLVDR